MMFENIINYLKNIGKKNTKSKETAKERLQLVLTQDRANVSADYLDLMKQEIIEVIKKYINIDEKALEVELTKPTEGVPSLIANIPILSVKSNRDINKKDTSSNQNTKNMGLTNLDSKHYSSSLNEAAVQLMASETNKTKEDLVTYYNLTLPTTSPTYYTLECALLKQISYFTGTYPLYHSTIYSNDIFKNTFIQKTSKHTYKIIEKNFNRLTELQDILSDLTNELQYSNANSTKIKSINIAINNKKDEIYNLFLKTQNIIMTNCFNNEFKNIKNIEDLKNFKSRVYNFQYLIATHKDYTFYRDFFYYTMNRIEQKEEYLEQNGLVFLPSDKETALTLFKEKESVFSFITTFFSKLKKLALTEVKFFEEK